MSCIKELEMQVIDRREAAYTVVADQDVLRVLQTLKEWQGLQQDARVGNILGQQVCRLGNVDHVRCENRANIHFE